MSSRRGWRPCTRRADLLQTVAESAEVRGAVVSVVIPCFNHAHFLAEAIRSAQAQTYGAIDVIVVDDASSDATRDVACRCLGVRYVRHRSRRGLASARNTGLRLARGEYVVFLDADDFLLPDGIQAGVRCLEARPTIGFAFGRYATVAADGQRLQESTPSVGTTDIYAALLERNVVAMIATAIFRRMHLLEVGSFDSRLQACEDYDVLLRLSHARGGAQHDGLIACYRRHDTNMSRRYPLMLRTSLRSLRKQRGIVAHDPRYFASYAAGLCFWKQLYGTRLFAEVRTDLRSRRNLCRAVWHLAVLVRHVGPRQVRAWFVESPKVAGADG